MTLEEAKEILKDYILKEDRITWKEDACLQYIDWYSGGIYATLDGEFTADQLEAVATWIRKND